MFRNSRIITKQDAAGSYEIELFDHPKPRRVIVCAHGNGVRRWDGEQFFYAVAEHFADCVVALVDQNQPEGDGVRLNPLPVLAERVAAAQKVAADLYPTVPLVIMAHSMGCGVVTLLDLSQVDSAIFVAPAAGDAQQKLIERYGPEIAAGKVAQTKDGRVKHITPEYFDSVRGIVWEAEYAKLLKRYSKVYVFEAGEEQIVGPERLAHRNLPFAGYQIIPGAPHDFAGQPLAELFARLDAMAELQ